MGRIGRTLKHSISYNLSNRNRSRSPLGGLTLSFGKSRTNFDVRHSNESFGMSPISACYTVLHTIERLCTNDGIL